MSNDTKCPIHPNASHTWGECCANAANKKAHKTNRNKDKKCPGWPKKNEADIGNNDVSIASNVTSVGAMAPCCVDSDIRNVCTVVLGLKQQGR
jgi:hypothetical protein